MVMALRGYFRRVETLKEKMRSFSFDQSRSSCCQVEHVVDGRNVLCDRLVVKECVSIWFGDQEAFEDYVRSKVAENLTRQLVSEVFTRHWSLAVTMPLGWVTLDLFATYAAIGEYENAFARLITGSVIWLLCGPMLIDYLICLTRRFSRKPTSTACEIMKNLAVLLMVMVFLSILVASVFLWRILPWHSQLERAGVFAAFWCLTAVAHVLIKAYVSGTCR